MSKLEEQGFLIRTPNARDKRTYDIRPTEKACAVYPFIKEQVAGSFQRMTQNMTEEERREFQRLLCLAAEAAITLED